MVRVNVDINQVSAEKLWSSEKKMPNKIKISSNVNIVEVEKGGKNSLTVPFVVTFGYNPSIAQISLKGEAKIGGKESEIDEIRSRYENKESPPTRLIQQITNNSIAEATMLSRTLNIPPPIPFPSSSGSKSKDTGRTSLNYVG
ncbi:MAG: hypothetical protein ACLFUR_00210 [Candidatus Hadarchaeia archaeon]